MTTSTKAIKVTSKKAINLPEPSRTCETIKIRANLGEDTNSTSWKAVEKQCLHLQILDSLLPDTDDSRKIISLIFS